MKMFIKLLVYNLRTINGHKNTAEGVLKALLDQDVREYKRSTKKKDVPEEYLDTQMK